MSVVLITGSSTGIGRLAALKLARDGHTVHASMKRLIGNPTVAEFAEPADAEGSTCTPSSWTSPRKSPRTRAVSEVGDHAGQLDVVVQNAGHPYVGYVEAFTDDDLTRLIDINAVGAHRVNRARHKFPNAGHASDAAVTVAYAMLDPLVERNEKATAGPV
jgi:NAD(P)-dependent dehydrogenase (short-subunit alcohol dehydrogenase family)